MAERRVRAIRRARVTRIERLAPEMVRVVFTGADLVDLDDTGYTDRYIKILFPPAGADYRWPFDPEAIKASRPPEQWPVTRTYTVRSHHPGSIEMAIDFVTHGSEGLAGPWAARAQPGDEIGFFGPGGGYAPDSGPGLICWSGTSLRSPPSPRLWSRSRPRPPRRCSWRWGAWPTTWICPPPRPPG